MLGMIGALIFGVVYAGAWMADENKEQRSRIQAKNNNSKYYFDKNGIMRHIKGGRKYTVQEISDTFNNKEELERKKQFYKKEYWGVTNLLDGTISDGLIELFLTEQEAIEYKDKIKKEIIKKYEENPDKFENKELYSRLGFISIGTFTEYRISMGNNRPCITFRYHKNF